MSGAVAFSKSASSIAIFMPAERLPYSCARHDSLFADLIQNLFDRFARRWMLRNRTPNADVVGAGLKRLARRHETLLIVWFRPSRANTLNRDFDLVAKRCAQRFNFMWASYDPVNSVFDAEFC